MILLALLTLSLAGVTAVLLDAVVHDGFRRGGASDVPRSHAEDPQLLAPADARGPGHQW